MVKYEYKRFKPPKRAETLEELDAWMNEIGAEGWELPPIRIISWSRGGKIIHYNIEAHEGGGVDWLVARRTVSDG